MIPAASLQVCETEDELHRSVADLLVDLIRQSLRDRGTCILALSGGETPRLIYRRLGAPPLSGMVDWRRVQLLFVDERMVPPGDPRSNFSMVEGELLSRVPIPGENIHRIAGEKEPLLAAGEYERDLEGLLSRGRQRIDCVLLGLGEDGHTASLFPGSAAIQERGALVRAVFHGPTRIWRVTMTLPLINAARKAVFVVSGKTKAQILGRVAREPGPTLLLPATMVQPAEGGILWMIDRQAASELSQHSSPEVGGRP